MYAVYRGIKHNNLFISQATGDMEKDSKLANGEVAYTIESYAQDMDEAQDKLTEAYGGPAQRNQALFDYIRDIYEKLDARKES